MSGGLASTAVQPGGETRMHERRNLGMVRAAGLGMIAVGGLFLAQGRFVGAQGRQGANAGGQDAEMLIAHGLEMAIESSTLQGLAMQAGGSAGTLGSGGSATGGSRSGTSGSGASGGAGGTSGTAGTGTSGTGTSGAT